MRIRIISGAVLTLILIAACAAGGIGVFVLSVLISAMGMYELYKAVGIEKSPMAVMGYVLGAAYYAMLWFDLMEYLILFCVASAVLTMMTYVICFKTRKAKDAGFTLLGIYYVAIPLSFLYRIRIFEFGESNVPATRHGIFMFILLFICSWIADTFAYFTGVTIGKNKIFPDLSPKKTIEGCAGGIIGSILIAFIYGLILDKTIGVSLEIPFIICAFVGSIVSIFGDLAASAIKRNHDIKDYSNLIPGHGGILDRFDSMIFVAPLVYICAYYVIPFFN